MINDKIDHNELYCDKILTAAKYNFLGVRIYNLIKSDGNIFSLIKIGKIGIILPKIGKKI